jgi:carbamoyl-phosphate synthase large subunit
MREQEIPVTQNPYTVLFTSAGRRVALIRHFKKTFPRLNLTGRIVGVDVSPDAPALHEVDSARLICRIDDPGYIDNLVTLCSQEQIHLLFPLIDTDLQKLAQSRGEFERAGTNAVVCDPELIDVTSNKYKSHDFFKSLSIDTPRIFELEHDREGDYRYPLFMKPLDGSASKSVFKINNKKELSFFREYVARPILQEYVAGDEFTLDMLYDFQGELRCIVPRHRIEVRSGEVSKSVIEMDPAVMEAGWNLGRQLRGARGVINVQCIRTNEGRVSFIEINPRFGGGTPLSLHAGADFPRWLLQMACGDDPGDVRETFEPGMYMLRFDDAVFLRGLPPLETI